MIQKLDSYAIFSNCNIKIFTVTLDVSKLEWGNCILKLKTFT